MNQGEKRVIFSVLLSIFLFLMLIFSAGYAYYMASINNSSVTNVNLKLPTSTSFFTTASDCMLDFSSSQMTLTNINTSVSDSCYLNVTINGSKGGYCTYDVILEEIGNETYVPSPGVGTSPFLFEYTASISGEATINETQVNQLKGTTLVSNKLITIASEGVSVTQTYNIVEKWYNLDLDQDSHSGKTYSFKLGVANISC